MTAQQIIQHIDKSANTYVRMFGMAGHMKTVDMGYYSYVTPADGEAGISFVFDVRIEQLSLAERKQVINEIKALHMPVWFSLLSSDESFRLFFGREKPHGQTVFAEDEEIYMAMFEGELHPVKPPADCLIKKVASREEFAVWAHIANSVLANGRTDLHPVYHYPLCGDGLMECYLAYCCDEPAAIAAIIHDDCTASLELVATLPHMRGKGYAKSICSKAVSDALLRGASLATVRAASRSAANIYQSIGFKAYNSAI